MVGLLGTIYLIFFNLFFTHLLLFYVYVGTLRASPPNFAYLIHRQYFHVCVASSCINNMLLLLGLVGGGELSATLIRDSKNALILLHFRFNADLPDAKLHATSEST